MEGTVFQIQPKYTAPEIWESLAAAQGLFYEPLELTSPPVMNDPVQMERCMNWYSSSGRVHSFHGAFIDVNPASGDAAFRELSCRRCEESCRMALRLGAKYVVFHSSAFPVLRGGYLAHWSDVCAAFYTRLAETYPLTICLENSADLDPEPLAVLTDKISHPGVRVCLDIGHAAYSPTSVGDWFSALGDRIVYLHLSDNMGTYDDHLPIGSGTVDWHAASAHWEALQRPTPITLEVGGADGVLQSMSYLRSHGLFGLGKEMP